MISGIEEVAEPGDMPTNELTLEVTPRIGKDAITLEINIWKGRYSTIDRSSESRRYRSEYSENYNESTSRGMSGDGALLLSTTVLLRDGEAYVLASGQTEAKQTITTGIPVLKDIPLLGYLFKRKSDMTITNDLIIFITPRILQFGEKIEK